MQQNSHINTLLTIVLGLLVLFTVYISYYLATYTVGDVPPETLSETYKGTLTMTLKPTVPASAPAGMYTFSLGTKTLTLKNDAHDYYAPAFSTDERVAFVASGGDNGNQLYISNVNNEETAEVLVPPSPALFAGTSHWSIDNTALVYDAITALPEVDNVEIENSRIVYVDTETNDQMIIDTGTSPIFQSDGSILYLKSDGVYSTTVTDMVASEPELVIPFDEYDATTRSRLAISADEKLIAITHPGAALFEVYHFVTLEDGSEVPAVVFGQDDTVFWPVFSPDRTEIAYVQIHFTDEKVSGKSLSIYNIETGKARPVFDLKEYSDENLSLTAWNK